MLNKTILRLKFYRYLADWLLPPVLLLLHTVGAAKAGYVHLPTAVEGQP